MSAKKQPPLAKKQVKRQLAWPVFRFRSLSLDVSLSSVFIRNSSRQKTSNYFSLAVHPFYPLLLFPSSFLRWIFMPLSFFFSTHTFMVVFSIIPPFLSFFFYALLLESFRAGDYLPGLHSQILLNRRRNCICIFLTIALPPFACSRIIPAVFSFLRPHPLRRYLLLVTLSFVQLPPVKLFFPEDFLNSSGSQWFSAVSIWYHENDIRFSEDCSRFTERFSSCTLGNIFPFDASFCFFFVGFDVCGSSVLVSFVGWIFRCL